MFTISYLAEVQKQMESGNSTDEIEVDLRLSVLKIYMPPGWRAFTTTWQAVWESGTLQIKRMEQSGNNQTCSREDNLIVWRSIWKYWGDPYLKVNWQRHRVK